MALSSGKKTRLPRPDPKSTLLQMVLKQVVTLPLERQDSIAIEILDSLAKADPKAVRFQRLIENKYTAGLSAEECTELEGLEADFRKGDEAFYGPILERIDGDIRHAQRLRELGIGKVNMTEVDSSYNGLDKKRQDPIQTLSTIEHQVLSMLVEGVRAKEIAGRLNVSVKTIETYRANLMRMDIHDLALVMFAISRNLTSTPA